MKHAINSVMVAILVALPIKASDQPVADEPGKPQENWLAICVIAAAAVAVGGVWIMSKRCKPRYYWLMDASQSPAVYWVGAATKKECEIEGWERIGGPYDRPEDAPQQHPPSTNRVDHVIVPMQISTQNSQDLVNWQTIHTEVNDIEDYSYYATNQGFFRIKVGQ